MTAPLAIPAAWYETELIARALRNDEAAIRAIVKQNNQRLFRLARSVLRNDADAEDVLQEAYVRAFKALPDFRQDSSLATWLTRIVLNESLQRLRSKRREPQEAMPLRSTTEGQIIPFPLAANPPLDPERTMAQRELSQFLEQAIDQLPEDFRVVLVARIVEDMSIEETAELLSLEPATVKTRLFRARRLLKTALAEHIGPKISGVFPFNGPRCEHMADAVVARLGLMSR